MEQRPCNSRRDRDEIALSIEHFDFAGAGEFGKIDRVAVTNARGSLVGRGDRRHGREKLSWMHKQRLHFSTLNRTLKLLERVRVLKSEFRN